MMTRKEMKTEVKSKLNPNLGFFVLLFLPWFIIQSLSIGINYNSSLDNLQVVNGGGNLVTNTAYSYSNHLFSFFSILDIINYLLMVGIMFVLIDIIRNKEPMEHGFAKSTNILKGSYLLPAILIGLLNAVFTFLWTLLFLIPGFIKSFSYSQAQFIYRDEIAKGNQISYLDAITKSRQLMDGHKWEYFILQLSFIWWYLLMGVTFGIAGIYVVPYVQMTNAAYYDQLVKNQTKTVTAA